MRSQSSGSSRLFVDTRTGALIESQGEYRTVVVLVSSGRERQFNQAVRETILRSGLQ